MSRKDDAVKWGRPSRTNITKQKYEVLMVSMLKCIQVIQPKSNIYLNENSLSKNTARDTRTCYLSRNNTDTPVGQLGLQQITTNTYARVIALHAVIIVGYINF